MEDLEKCEDMKQLEIKDSIPVCAAINELHLFHVGDIFKDLAYIFYKTNPGMWNDTKSGGDLNKRFPSTSRFIPLSKERIHFLISLLDLTYQSI